MKTYAILVTNNWTGKRVLMPGTYDELMGIKTIKALKANVLRTDSIPNNIYEIVEIAEPVERGAGDDYPIIPK